MFEIFFWSLESHPTVFSGYSCFCGLHMGIRGPTQVCHLHSKCPTHYTVIQPLENLEWWLGHTHPYLNWLLANFSGSYLCHYQSVGGREVIFWGRWKIYSHPEVFRTFFWFCTQASLLDGSGGHNDASDETLYYHSNLKLDLLTIQTFYVLSFNLTWEFRTVFSFFLFFLSLSLHLLSFSPPLHFFLP